MEAINFIEMDLQLIREEGRQIFLNRVPDNFSRIVHDYSDPDKGFLMWKGMIEERISEDISLRQLHFFIQRSFGWTNSHLFEFKNSQIRPSLRVGMPDDYDFEYTPPRQDAHCTKLKETFVEAYRRRTFWYNYDFGDDWCHKLRFLKPTKSELANFSGFPVCLKAEGKCPPEDVGGWYGYVEFLEIVKDRKHPDYEDSRMWAGLDLKEPYNELVVDLQEINTRMMDFFSSSDQYDGI